MSYDNWKLRSEDDEAAAETRRDIRRRARRQAAEDEAEYLMENWTLEERREYEATRHL